MAGQFRQSEKNIGVAYYQIPLALRQLLDDTQYWIEHQVYTQVEIAVRFKHRLVSIHCFPNGNGRHSRLMADLLMTKVFALPMLSWERHLNLESSVVRARYLDAIRKADGGNLSALLAFAANREQ